MKYLEALHWKRRNQGLIGSDDNGFVVSDLFIVPSNPVDRDNFSRQYFLS